MGWLWPWRGRRWEYLVVWEYREGTGLTRWLANGKLVPSVGEDEAAMLNYFGARGWELVGRDGYYFKRSKR